MGGQGGLRPRPRGHPKVDRGHPREVTRLHGGPGTSAHSNSLGGVTEKDGELEGPRIHAYWYRVFRHLTKKLHDQLFTVLADPTRELPSWFVWWRTVLIPKSPEARSPEKQRPITCLNIGYKVLTGALTAILRSHAEKVGLLPLEQKALRKGSRGCLDALAVDTAVFEEVTREKKDLSVAWVDFKKAYDRVPHKWIRRCLRVMKAPKVVRRTDHTPVANRYRGERPRVQGTNTRLF